MSLLLNVTAVFWGVQQHQTVSVQLFEGCNGWWSPCGFIVAHLRVL